MNSIKPNLIRQYSSVEEKTSILPYNLNTNRSNRKSPAFSSSSPVKPSEGLAKKALNSLAKGVDNIQRYIEKGGFIAEFLVVDFVGMVIPRVYQAYHRNEKELGHPNYAAAKEEFTREILSGPCMFVIPMAFLMASKRMFGSASHVKLNMLKKFKEASVHAVENPQKDQNILKGFYNKVVDTLYGSKINEKSKEGIVESFINLHNADPKKVKDLKSEVEEALISANKKIGNSQDLGISQADSSKIKFDKNKSPISIGNFVEDCHNYSTDVVNSLLAAGKEANKGLVDKIHDFKEGARKLVTTVAVTSMSAFLLYIPKLYSQNKEYPGLAGLSINPDKDDNKLTKEESKQ